MIDTPKLVKRLEDAGMGRPQAEAFSEGLADGLKGASVGKPEFDAAVKLVTARLDTHDKLLWFIAAGVVALFVRSFFP